MSKLTKAQETERAEAIAELRKMLKPGTTVSTILRHVSSSGMSRSISAVIADKQGRVITLDWLLVRAGIGTFDRTHGGIKMGGCGMDMGFALVYDLSRTLYLNGYKCTGHDGTGRAPRCASNDHSNYRAWIEAPVWSEEAGERVGGIRNPEPNYKRGMLHRDGGYALKQTWL